MEKWTRLLIITATSLLLLTLAGVIIHLSAYIHHTLLLFSLGALIAYALDPLVERLRALRPTRHGRTFSRVASVSVVFVGLLVLIGLAVWTLEGHLVAQVTAFQRDYPAYHDRAMDLAASADASLTAHGIRFSLSDALTHPPAEVKAFGNRLGREALPFVGHFFAGLGESLIVLLIAVYFLLFATEMREKFNGLLPDNLRQRADLWETDVNRILGGFVRGQLIIALLMGGLAAVGCLALGIHLWLLIGLFVTVAALIPVFGPYIGGIPAIFAALIGPTHLPNNLVAALIVMIYFVVINEIGSKILYPKLVGAALGMHTVFVLFVLFAGLEVAGVVGVLFAAPLTALAIVSIVHLYRFWQDLPDSLLSNVARREGRRAEDRPLP